ncbi:sigma-70 family RNA polymerase sigma factor [Bacillus idriensis]|uniref:Sigma-70 family RNA polymerase sigma factor n=2 Tax=Metabacillus idriensis TaxID=324768 RepID=A0A6I2M796_9BACI|nr:sigma-70 family RNA polymerase sigma factor [Metabacillus idriensis]
MKQHKEQLYRTAFMYLRNETDALEAVQEVTFRAYKSLHKVKESSFFTTYLIRIMLNYCHDQMKRNKRIQINQELAASRSGTDSFVHLEIEEALLQLDEKYQNVIMMKYIHDLKIKDIAQQLNCPESTVKTWITKALALLRQHLDEGGNFHV